MVISNNLLLQWGYSPKPANTKHNEVTLPLSYISSYSAVLQGINTTTGMYLSSEDKTLSFLSFDSNRTQSNKYAGYWFTIGY